MTPVDKMIARFMAVYGEPRTTDPEMFLAEYRKALTPYSAEILEAATDRLILSSAFWPKPAEAIAEAQRVIALAPKSRPIDWDAVEAERRKGWTFNDVTKAASKFDGEEHEAMMKQWRAFMKGFGPPVRFDENGKLIRPALTERSRDMSSDRDPTGEQHA